MDGGVPARTADSVVEINVNRNLEAPRFTEAEYVVDVPFNKPVDSFVVQVAASDLDPLVKTFLFIVQLKVCAGQNFQEKMIKYWTWNWFHAKPVQIEKMEM